MPTVDILTLDATNKKLITYLQEDFPLVLRPFQELGKRISLSEEEVMRRILSLKAAGIIKRIGPVHDSQNLGFKRTLVGMSVEDEHLEKTVCVINSFSEVTHNYLRRDDGFNLWFTLICPTKKRITAILKEIKQKSGVTTIISLPTVKTIKIRTVFKV